MAIRKGIKEIDGVVFEAEGLDLRTEGEVLIRIMKIAVPVLAALAGSIKDAMAAGPAIVQSLSYDEYDYLCQTFATVSKWRAKTQAKGGTLVPISDQAFTKGVSSQMQWLWFCLEHQYGDFLGARLSTALTAFQAKVGLPSESLKG